jgi:hypothetical protein
MRYELKFPHIDNDEIQVLISVTKECAKEFNDSDLACILTYVNESYTTCLVISGDDPLDNDSKNAICDILRAVRALADDFNKQIKLCTNYPFDKIDYTDDKDISEIFQYINILVADNIAYKKINNTFTLINN